MNEIRLSPSMQAVLQRMGRVRRTPLHTMAAPAARAAYAAVADVLEVPRTALPRVVDLHVPARDGAQLPLRLYTPVDGVLPLLLYFHGGGFTVGSIATHDILCRELARLSGCAVASLDYRLAPEHRFPVAANDARDALAWLAGNGHTIGIDPGRLAVGGDSAGGTLAAVCAIQARDAGLRLALQLLFYPGCAPWQDSPSHARYGQGLLLDSGLIQFFFSQYLRSDADRTDWRFAPLVADDVDGVAPAWFGLAECDPVVDEALAYADKLRAAGVPVDLALYRGVTHEFIKMGRALPEALRAHADAAHALQQAFGTFNRL
jgi:acetyl esterase